MLDKQQKFFPGERVKFMGDPEVYTIVGDIFWEGWQKHVLLDDKGMSSESSLGNGWVKVDAGD